MAEVWRGGSRPWLVEVRDMLGRWQLVSFDRITRENALARADVASADYPACDVQVLERVRADGEGSAYRVVRLHIGNGVPLCLMAGEG